MPTPTGRGAAGQFYPDAQGNYHTGNSYFDAHYKNQDEQLKIMMADPRVAEMVKSGGSGTINKIPGLTDTDAKIVNGKITHTSTGGVWKTLAYTAAAAGIIATAGALAPAVAPAAAPVAAGAAPAAGISGMPAVLGGTSTLGAASAPLAATGGIPLASTVTTPIAGMMPGGLAGSGGVGAGGSSILGKIGGALSSPLGQMGILGGLTAASGGFGSGSGGDLTGAAADSIKQQSELSKSLAGYSKDQYELSRPAQTQALGLYSKLASGNRGEVNAAIAPQLNTINEQWRGNQSHLEQQGIRGGARDAGIMEANRMKTMQMGMLPMQARMDANDKLGTMGLQGTGQGLQGLSGAAGANASAMRGLADLQSEQNRQKEIRAGKIGAFGRSMSDLLMPWLMGQRGGK
jgi:hypothetical protein